MIDATLIYFIVLGLIGGIAHVILDAENWEDLKHFSSFKKSVTGAICGFLYFFLYSEYDFPNTVMTFVAGYAGTDFIVGILEKVKKKTES